MIATIARVLAETTNPDQQKSLIDDAGPIAMAFVVALGIAMFFLWKSLSNQMKRIDPNLPAGHEDREQAYERKLTQDAIERGKADRNAAGAVPDADDATGQ
jgi:hypothetical protein